MGDPSVGVSGQSPVRMLHSTSLDSALCFCCCETCTQRNATTETRTESKSRVLVLWSFFPSLHNGPFSLSLLLPFLYHLLTAPFVIFCVLSLCWAWQVEDFYSVWLHPVQLRAETSALVFHEPPQCCATVEQTDTQRGSVLLCCQRSTLWLYCHKHEELICPAVVGWILNMLTELLPYQSPQASSCPQPPGSVVGTSNFSAVLVAPVSIRL